MINLQELKNITAIGNLIEHRARHFTTERDWEDYLASQGIGVETDSRELKRPTETMQIWDVGWNNQRLADWQNGRTQFLVKKYLVLPRELVEKALILMILP